MTTPAIDGQLTMSRGEERRLEKPTCRICSFRSTSASRTDSRARKLKSRPTAFGRAAVIVVVRAAGNASCHEMGWLYRDVKAVVMDASGSWSVQSSNNGEGRAAWAVW